MSKIHIFQRFSQRENVVTNNTLLLLARLYEINRLLFEKLLGQLVSESAADKIGLQFEQQRGVSGGTVTDGMLHQASVRLVLETKLWTPWRDVQLKGHLNAFTGNEDLAVLVMLGPDYPPPDFRKKANALVDKKRAESKARSLGLTILTFEDLLSNATEVFAEIEPATILLRDFEGFIVDQKLLPKTKNLCRVVPCGVTFEDNKRLRLYYEPSSRNSQETAYLGIYAWKSVRLLGVPSKIVNVEVKNGKYCFEESVMLSEAEKARIREASECAKRYGWSDSESRKFTLFDDLWPTNFVKSTSQGIRGHRNLNLKEALGTDFNPDPKILAERLRDKTWS